MAKRKKALRKPPRKRAKIDRFPMIEKALKKRTKADLIMIFMKLARNSAELSRALETKLDVQKPAELQLSDLESAICRATDFDDRASNDNFDFDYEAYEEVQRGFKNFIALGHLEDVKALSKRLMKDGSYQVECSDEGLMTDNIQDCLKPVIRAVKAKGGASAREWAHKMLLADRVG